MNILATMHKELWDITRLQKFLLRNTLQFQCKHVYHNRY